MWKGVRRMVLGLKIRLREILIRVVLTIARWIIDHLDNEGDAAEPGPDGSTPS